MKNIIEWMQLFIALDTSSALIVVVVNYLIDILGEIYILGNVFYFILSLFDEYLLKEIVKFKVGY